MKQGLSEAEAEGRTKDLGCLQRLCAPKLSPCEEREHRMRVFWGTVGCTPRVRCRVTGSRTSVARPGALPPCITFAGSSAGGLIVHDSS